jgi:hypothetical protein
MMFKIDPKRKIIYIYGAIILLALILRFVRYDQRFGLAYDQARDAIVARQIMHGQGIPLVGPFSSAGNFTAGPIWYWFLAIATAVFPFTVMSPWIVMTILFVGSVALFIIVGEIIDGTTLAVILGLLVAVSPAQIDEGSNLINHALVAVFSMTTVGFGFWYAKTGKTISIIFLGLSIGAAASGHYEAALMGIFILYLFAIRRPSIKAFLIFLICAVLPFIPLVIFDLNHNFYNIRGILDYSRYGQYKIYIPNRWLTYAGVFIPNLWGMVTGGNNIMGYIAIAITGLATAFAIKTKQLNRYIVGIFISLVAMIFITRYYRGERFVSYFVFLHPFMLIATAWACNFIYQKQKIAGILLVSAIVISGMIPTIKNINNSVNFTQYEAKGWKQVLTAKYPKEKFDVYDFRYNSPGKSLALVLYLDQVGLISPTGRRIGFGMPPKLERPHHQEIKENTFGYDIWDLSASSSAVLVKNEWARVNPENVYTGATNWYKTAGQLPVATKSAVAK